MELLREQAGYFVGACGRSYHPDGSAGRGENGRVVNELLRKHGFADSTLVVFAGDNGMALPHGKGSLYDPGLNVHLVVRWPGVVKPGGESRLLISGEDLAPALSATYFTTPRPVYELYDLDADPSELNNLSGNPEHAASERELREALAEKMILDFDYLPLPALGPGQAGAAGAKDPADVDKERAAQFQHKDSNRDGRLRHCQRPCSLLAVQRPCGYRLIRDPERPHRRSSHGTDARAGGAG
jgi:hypothetical protein